MIILFSDVVGVRGPGNLHTVDVSVIFEDTEKELLINVSKLENKAIGQLLGVLFFPGRIQTAPFTVHCSCSELRCSWYQGKRGQLRPLLA
jgi:hypothetical protein